MHVGITQELKSNVRGHIREMECAELKMQLGKSSMSDLMKIKPDSPSLTKLLWGEHLHLKELMPKDWIKDMNRDYAPYFHVEIQPTDPSKKVKSFRLTIDGKGAVLTPPNRSSGSTFRIRESDVVDDLKKLSEIFDTHNEIHDKWVQITNDVIAFLDSAKSLNSAIKAWKDLRAFIPSEYLARVDRKPKRKESEQRQQEVLATINRNLAVTSAAVVKLASV